jgi:hypothetical protein
VASGRDQLRIIASATAFRIGDAGVIQVECSAKRAHHRERVEHMLDEHGVWIADGCQVVDRIPLGQQP